MWTSEKSELERRFDQESFKMQCKIELQIMEAFK